ncbi:MAG: hypothetical protein GX605_13525, partial [Chloroflexi bacterium]|nr:hypothetical protein [Chloroflexota bacterium]
ERYLAQAEVAGQPGFRQLANELQDGFRWRTEVTYQHQESGEPLHAVLFFEQWGATIFVHRVVAPESRWAEVAPWVARLADSFEAYEAGLHLIPEGWIPFAHTVAGFEMLYPEGWEEEADDAGITLRLADGAAGFAVQGAPLEEGGPLSAEEWGQAVLAELRAQHPDLQIWVEGRGRLAQLGGWYAEVEFANAQGQAVREAWTVALSAEWNWRYTMRYWSPAATWDEHLPDFRLARQGLRATAPDR